MQEIIEQIRNDFKVLLLSPVSELTRAYLILSILSASDQMGEPRQINTSEVREPLISDNTAEQQ